jgi:hypothetical protein
MRHLIRYISASTLKREFATFVMGWWMALGTYLMLRLPISQQVADASLIAWGGLAVPVFGLAAAAYGTDWISKQTTIAGPPASADPTVIAETEIKVPTVTTVTTTAAAPPETSS